MICVGVPFPRNYVASVKKIVTLICVGVPFPRNYVAIVNKIVTLMCVGVPFPRNYIASVKKIMTRLFRVFVHVYIHHFDKLVGIGAVSLAFIFRCSFM